MQEEDFRPPWVYTATNLMNYVLIPGIFMYSIFIYDWGDHDHVFQAPRRWLKRQKEAFWSLSSEDQKLIEATESKPETKST
ncbi:hypothetical protein BDZ89DRAFT_1126452 [Hymenopellis radicata]|nr:hypothetical protein BDZ89DRAFT_1126452 [Hymenopellis radicata]